MTKICNVYECFSVVRCKGLCGKHYQCLRKHGDVQTNYASYAKWRKRKRAESYIELPENTYKLTYDEVMFLRANFRECVSEFENGHNYKGSLIKCLNMNLAFGISNADITL